MYAYPKHVRTDHPVLVYKTCEIERTVLRLFSCLPPSLSPHNLPLLSYFSLYLKFSFGSVTSTTNTLSSLLAACHKVVSLNTDGLVVEDTAMACVGLGEELEVLVLAGGGAGAFPFDTGGVAV